MERRRSSSTASDTMGGSSLRIWSLPLKISWGNDLLVHGIPAQTQHQSEKRMEKPRIFLGSSGKQEKLLEALTRGLHGVAQVEPWMTSFNPGVSTLERLVELTREVDFAAFVFAQDDWTTNATPGAPAAAEQPVAVPGQASPRDNVVFEAGLF